MRHVKEENGLCGVWGCLGWKPRVCRVACRRGHAIFSSVGNSLEVEVDGEIICSCGLARQVQR